MVASQIIRTTHARHVRGAPLAAESRCYSRSPTRPPAGQRRMKTVVERIAEFTSRTRYDDMDEPVALQLRIRVLDALGCAIGAIGANTIEKVRSYVMSESTSGSCAIVGGGMTSPRLAALLNGSLVRYLDFNDAYIARGETCHPSDNFAALLAAAELSDASGRELLAALATAYQVQCRLSDEAPVRERGFDHTSQLVVATAAGVSRALRLDAKRTGHAIAIAGTALHGLRVTRTGKLSEWKGLAAPFAAACATEGALLAAAGVTGPLELFEGAKGFMETLSGPFDIDWSREGLDRVHRTILKRYNAEIHSQSVIDAILALRRAESIDPNEIEHLDIEIFDVAYNIIGGGNEGEKTRVQSKEQADHSLPYIAAAALLDGRVTPAQYLPERVQRADVQQLLARVSVRPKEEFSRRFPEEMPCRITLRLRSGRAITGASRRLSGLSYSAVRLADGGRQVLDARRDTYYGRRTRAHRGRRSETSHASGPRSRRVTRRGVVARSQTRASPCLTTILCRSHLCGATRGRQSPAVAG